MAAEDVRIADQFRAAVVAAVATGDREAVYALLDPDVEWVTPQRTLRGLDEMREQWTWGSAPETFDYTFEEGDWVDHGEGRLACDVRQAYLLKGTSDVAYERNRRVELTLRDGKICRYELAFTGT